MNKYRHIKSYIIVSDVGRIAIGSANSDWPDRVTHATCLTAKEYGIIFIYELIKMDRQYISLWPLEKNQQYDPLPVKWKNNKKRISKHKIWIQEMIEN